MRIWIGLIALVWAGPVLAQSIEERREACAAGDQVACAVLRAFENAVDSVQSEQPETQPAQPPAPEAQTQAAPVPPTQASPEATAAPEPQEDAGRAGLTWWQKLLIACGVLYLLSSLARGITKTMAESDAQEIWDGKPLPLPKFLPGPRDTQGNLRTETDPKRQIVPWDRTEVFNWLDQEIQRVQSNITNANVLEYARLCTAGEEVPAALSERVVEELRTRVDGGTDAMFWTDKDIRYFNLIRARYFQTRGGFQLASTAYFFNALELPHNLLLDLWRLDADRDFNPAAVNMWAIIHDNGLYAEPYVDIPTSEAYLRHFFNLGAPDGHFHIASQLVNFYAASPYLRSDDGYVAAAMDRIRSYDTVSYYDWIRFMERNKLEFDLEDKSVSRGGLLFELAQQATGPIQ